MIIVRSPLRISLGGGGTDLPSFYKNHGGFVISAAINKYVFTTITKPFEEGYYLKYSSTEKVKDIKKIKQPTLVIHGREDQIIPLQSSLTLANWIDDAQLHVFGRCGHWTQIEHADRFCQLLENFFAEAA